jgi:hypothetical protein
MQTGSLTSFPSSTPSPDDARDASELGMEIPSGPLAYRSEAEPLPLSELERSILVAAGTGVTGWSFGVPFGPTVPRSMPTTRSGSPADGADRRRDRHADAVRDRRLGDVPHQHPR